MASKPTVKSTTKSKEIRLYKFNAAWENETWAKGWLVKNGDTHNVNKQAFCQVCRKPLRAHPTDLKAHSTRDSHIQQFESLSVKSQPKITSICKTQTDKKKENHERDLKLAVYIATHSSIRSVDHLTEILKVLSLQDLKLHKTKCGNLIKYVIAPNMLKELIDDVGDCPYSLIIDESTDVSTMKFLCLCIKYFSHKQNKVITNYLGLIEVVKTDADTLCSAIIKYSAEINLNLKNLIALGTDGGSNLCGKNHSVYTLLREQFNANLQLVRCICHSLNNAASAAANHFPANIEFLCREIYNWFNHSAIRKSEYMTTWETINADAESDDELKDDEILKASTGNEKNRKKKKQKMLKFVQLSATRWLARYNVVKIILLHYIPLKTHFDLVVNTEKDFTARMIADMLKDHSNYLYLLIIKPILGEINYVNASFQSTFVDLGAAHDDLKDLLLLLARKIMKSGFLSEGLDLMLKNLDNELAYLPVEKADFGIEYKNALFNCNISKDIQLNIETRAFKFIKTLCVELSKRLPVNLTLYHKLKFLSPSVCLSQTLRPRFSDLPFSTYFLPSSKLGTLENQWNKLLTVDWVFQFGDDAIKNSNTFWPIVYSFKNAGGKIVFKELATYALTLLSFPSSNAVVERVFSIMNQVKTKIRNHMLLPMLDSILRIRMQFYADNMCCKTFKPSSAMLGDFNYKVLYPQMDKENNEKSDNLIEEEFEVYSLLNAFDTCISIPEL